MFPHVRNLRDLDARALWRHGRAAELRAEFEDVLFRLRSLTDSEHERCLITMMMTRQQLLREYCPLQYISDDGILAMADAMRRSARRCVDIDAGGSWGYILVAVHIESLILPGEDAAFVSSMSERLFKSVEDARRAASGA